MVCNQGISDTLSLSSIFESISRDEQVDFESLVEINEVALEESGFFALVVL